MNRPLLVGRGHDAWRSARRRDYPHTLTPKAELLGCAGMATKTYNVSVTEAQGWFVEQQVRLGRYNNISEVVRDGLRRLEAEAAQRDLDEFNRVFTGAYHRPETAADIQRINRALKQARARGSPSSSIRAS